MVETRDLWDSWFKIRPRLVSAPPDVPIFRHVTAENSSYGQKILLRPKNTLTAVITVSAVLRHSISSSYGFGVSAKISFRSHTKSRHV